MEVTEGGEDEATDRDVVDSVEHTVEAGGGGKKAPLGIGRGKTGMAARPTVLPCPGNLILAVEASAEGWSTLAAAAAAFAA